MRTPIVTALLVAPLACIAQEYPERISLAGWYAGGAFGQAKASDTCSDIPYLTSSVLITCDNKDDYAKAYIGYDVLPILAIEAGAHYLGKYRLNLTDGIDTISAAATASAATLRAVVNWKADPFYAFFAGGVARWALKVDAQINSEAFYSARDSGYSLHWGIGGGVNLNKWWSVRAEYEEFPNVGEDATTGKDDIKALSLGLQFKF